MFRNVIASFRGVLWGGVVPPPPPTTTIRADGGLPHCPPLRIKNENDAVSVAALNCCCKLKAHKKRVGLGGSISPQRDVGRGGGLNEEMDGADPEGAVIQDYRQVMELNRPDADMMQTMQTQT